MRVKSFMSTQKNMSKASEIKTCLSRYLNSTPTTCFQGKENYIISVA